MMTLERASELVAKLYRVNTKAGIDLFGHFVGYFNITDEESQTKFAVMCGFPEQEYA